MLPNSKLIIRIDPSVDITKAKKAADVFNQVEIPVTYTLDEYYKRKTKNGSVWTKKFLLNHDPIFRKALELK